MKRIKVYEGFAGNVFITDKMMPRPYELVGQFDEVPEAEKWVESEYEISGVLDKVLKKESQYTLSDEDADWYCFNYFDYV